VTNGLPAEISATACEKKRKEYLVGMYSGKLGVNGVSVTVGPAGGNIGGLGGPGGGEERHACCSARPRCDCSGEPRVYDLKMISFTAWAFIGWANTQ
jgi:hypothetical protein